jgi:chromosome segregation ATPase
MYRFIYSLVVSFVLVVAWGPSPAGAHSTEYQKAQAEYNRTTAWVQSAQARLDRAEAAVPGAQANYDRATAQYNQAQAKLDAQINKKNKMLSRMDEIKVEMDNLSLFSIFEARRLSAEHTRLYNEWFKADEVKKKLENVCNAQLDKKLKAKWALEDAQRAVWAAKNSLSLAKQQQRLAERELARLRKKRQSQVSYTGSFGSGYGEWPYWLRQVQDRWGLTYLPGSTIGVTTDICPQP